MASQSFVHLHCHSSYSLLDGAAKVEDYIKKAVESGMPAIAATDHGTLSGLPEYERVCREHGIKFIPGIELYQARNSVAERPRQKSKTDEGEGETGKAFHHLLALALNQTGYKNLIQLSTKSYLEGYHRKPRVDWEMLEQHNEGILITSSCLGGIILQELIHDRRS
jgi:DNA polymerase-3 subunit alpha